MSIESLFSTEILRTAQETTLAEVAAARVSEYMTPDPWVVPVEWTARQVATRMINHGIRHAPVTRDGDVIGVVSSLDLLAHLALSGDDAGHNEDQPAGGGNLVEGSGR